MSFTLTKLAGTGVLVRGTDNLGVDGSEVIDDSQWVSFKAEVDVKDATALIDAAIAAHIAPITEAIEAANAKIARPDLDPLTYYVEAEGVDYVAGQPRQLRKLNRESQILRAIEENQDDRLIWVNGALVVTAAPVPDPVVVSDIVTD